MTTILYPKRALRRHKNVCKALRKRSICQHNYGWEWYDNLHQYSKNKIHCSCALCSAKTRNKKYSRRKTYQPGIDPCIRDRRRLEEMLSMIKEWSDG